MKSSLKKILAVTGLTLTLIVLYYGVVILNARAKTSGIVSAALNSGRMKLALDDLTAEPLQALLTVQDKNFYNHKGFDISTPGTGVTTISQDLTWDEYLGLVAMIRSPNTLHYVKNQDANQHRVSRIKQVLRGEYVPVDNSDWMYDRR